LGSELACARGDWGICAAVEGGGDGGDGFIGVGGWR
jgi:hypothetical protein